MGTKRILHMLLALSVMPDVASVLSILAWRQASCHVHYAMHHYNAKLMVRDHP